MNKTFSRITAILGRERYRKLLQYIGRRQVETGQKISISQTICEIIDVFLAADEAGKSSNNKSL